ncbi:homeobox-DDT domain protein RLT1-like isoform X1 [Cucurbita maxima]|uniref:Homeobox-DDT domain protein RLT1-like isoform X1 n=1 Tax=Cucurbita maxima TaxID=3661 RepID=A0A6J1KUA7_CUCMA|nr:homeobox-DDT domain protein RLT1-like isoform X1 [Cucurbita maxima]
MEAAASDGGNHNLNNDNINKISNSSEGLSRPKRQMKTPFQLETLEKAFALETYPSESTRAELSEKLGLTDRQLQMWFCHRRLKDKKEPAKKPRNVVPAFPDSPIDELRVVAEPGSDYASGSGSGSSPFGDVGLRNVASGSGGDDMLMTRRYYEPSRSIMELRAIACVESQLGEPLREDGPIIGIEFDSLPPDAFGAPLVAEQQKRSGHLYGDKYDQRDAKSNKATARAFPEYPFMPDQSRIRADAYGPVAQSHYPDSLVEVSAARNPSFLLGREQLNRSHNYHGQVSRVRLLSQQEQQGIAVPSPADDNTFVPASIRNPIVVQEDSYMLPDGQVFPNDVIIRMERKRKSEEARLNKEAEAHEIRMRKELEKQDNLRKKSEERIRKEMEKQDRERRKEEERLQREKQREVERLKREERRELERREKFLQREYLKAEKRRQKEAIRKEKEAVRRKAAIEKATARRIARESMELIEDEQLELMEIAAANKGLSSILSLDHDTLQNLESFRDYLGAFPPKSVQLKKPFSIQPWINSEENIGNLLMVWRFFITFSDVLELWPFTLDEFVQALHDYDSRLLGEIHICLLRLIVKDIEDVARTPSAGLGMNQNGVANTGGGHPQIVEGAYAWGFDICNWQKHLNPLTWPEIFRQLALSAGFGPQLKRSLAWSEMRSNDEAKCGEDVVSTLRNGSAAENAFSIMQEKGLLAPRRSRHRLTPGTVKFAAFHVLSLEGSEGLTVLELAEKIQRSGLRDLSTSRTPEASISVALTRDTKLFERIAPSTYRVRSPYRKDPDDAEDLLSVARKKIQVFQNGFLAGEDADDVERDEESECDDVDEDPEVDDVAMTSLVNEDVSKGDANLGVENENSCHDIDGNPQNEIAKNIPSSPLSGSKDTKYLNIPTEQQAAVDGTTVTDLDQENMEIDESKEGESWIQGLTEGEYHDLSVEERLNALIALTSIANEGNSIRLVLEDRLEAANAVKKQMLAEAQIDKSRLKEEIITKSDFPIHIVSKVETELNGSAMEDGQSPFPVADSQNNETTLCNAENLGSVPNERATLVPDFFPVPDNFLAQQCGHASKRSRSQLKSYIAQRAEEMYTYRSLPLGRDRRRNRYWQFVASSSSNDPGSGRIFVEMYDGKWMLIDSEEGFDALSMALDTRGVRESHLRIMLQMIETSFKENVRRNLQCVNVMVQSRITPKNENDESSSSPDCNASFNSPSSTVCGLNLDTTITSSSFRIELGRNENEKKAAFKRYQDLHRWMLRECFSTSTLCAMEFGEKRCMPLLDICDSCLCLFDSQHSHCSSCHQTYGTSENDTNFLEHECHCTRERKSYNWDTHALDASLPLKSRLLKALLAFIEVHVPSEAFQLFWTEHRKDWGVRMKLSSTIEELLQILTLFESVIKRDFLKSDFTTTDEHLSSCSISRNVIHDAADVGSVLTLPWIPRTSAAVALRLCEIDVSIYYIGCEKPEPDQYKEIGEHVNFPSRFVQIKNENELDYDGLMKQENLADPKNLRNSYKRDRRSRDHGRRKRWQKKVNGSKSSRVRPNVKSNEKMNEEQRELGQGMQVLGVRGPRTVRKRRAENSIPDEGLLGLVPSSSTRNIDESPKDYIGKWEDEKMDRFVDMEDDENVMEDEENEEDEENVNNVEPMDSDEDAQEVGYEQGSWEYGIDNGTSNRWNGDLGVASDEEDVELSEDYNGTEEGGNDFGEEELDDDTSVESDCSPNRIGNNGGRESPVSDDYSD